VEAPILSHTPGKPGAYASRQPQGASPTELDLDLDLDLRLRLGRQAGASTGFFTFTASSLPLRARLPT
jgi:hypothetical protein